jgi:signal transduction histidine kinase
MKQYYGFILIAWLALEKVLTLNVDTLGIAALLGALCLFILKEKYFDTTYGTVIFLIVMLALSQYNNSLILLAGIPILDFCYRKKYPFGMLVFVIVLLIFIEEGNYNYSFYMAFGVLFGYAVGQKDDNEKNYISVLDKERRLRYHLEEAQVELINSRREIEHLTEIRERNRIAHEIHDNVGHSIAGVIFQIEAGLRIINKDKEKLEEILKLCSRKLSQALELTRNTVYNIKADKKVGLELLEKIMGDFKFCAINFEYSGDFNGVSATNMKILEANIMESLTNASKYSQAKNIHIKIDIGRKNIRLYYKDDGIGCGDVNENLGIVGMRDRVKNAGGTISIDGNNGFLIVCNLPVKEEKYEEAEEIESFSC